MSHSDSKDSTQKTRSLPVRGDRPSMARSSDESSGNGPHTAEETQGGENGEPAQAIRWVGRVLVVLVVLCLVLAFWVWAEILNALP